MALEWRNLNEDEKDDLSYVENVSGRILGGVTKNFGQKSWCGFTPFTSPVSFITLEQAKKSVEDTIAALYAKQQVEA